MSSQSKSNKSVLSDSNSPKNINSVIMTFGRFNPPHKGHLKMFKSLSVEASNNKVKNIYIFPSFTVDNNKNPLSFDNKSTSISNALEKFKKENRMLVKNQNWFLNSDRNINTPVKAIQILAKNFDKIFFVCGSDRSLSYSKFGKYALNEDGATVEYNIISLNRNDTAENNSGLSASKLRQMVKNTIERQHDISFKKMLFKQSFIDEDTSNEIFNKIREKYSKKNSKKSRRNSPSNVGHTRSRLRRNTVK